MNNNILLKGAFFAVFAVILGAFGAHALKAVLTESKLESYHTATRYLMYHGLALLLLGYLHKEIQNNWIKYASQCMFLGTILFSGSILLLVNRELLGMEFLKALGPVTPLGGTVLIAGWICLIVSIFKNKQ